MRAMCSAQRHVVSVVSASGFICVKVGEVGLFLEGFLVVQRLLQENFWLEGPSSVMTLKWSEIA